MPSGRACYGPERKCHGIEAQRASRFAPRRSRSRLHRRQPSNLHWRRRPSRSKRSHGEVPMKRLVLLAAAAVSLGATGVEAQEKLKIGIIATLSGPPAVLGQQLRNGFNLAVKTLDGKLGGRDVEVIVADDELKPDLAVHKAKALGDRDKGDFLVG